MQRSTLCLILVYELALLSFSIVLYAITKRIALPMDTEVLPKLTVIYNE